MLLQPPEITSVPRTGQVMAPADRLSRASGDQRHGRGIVASSLTLHSGAGSMKWTRRFFSPRSCSGTLLAGVSCTAADSPTESGSRKPTSSRPICWACSGRRAPRVDGLVGDVLDGAVGSVLNVTDVLICTSQPYAVDAQDHRP